MSEIKKEIVKYISLNAGSNFCNLVVERNGKQFSLGCQMEEVHDLVINELYEVRYHEVLDKNKRKLVLDQVALAKETLNEAEYYQALYESSGDHKIPLLKIREKVESYLHRIQNPIILAITKQIYESRAEKFYLHPAGITVHHSGVGGLAVHTLSMLEMANNYIQAYDFLSPDLMFAGIILHDYSKMNEISGLNGGYTLNGNLIGHLIDGAMNIAVVAEKLGYASTEEAILLEHIVISHHGQLNYGSHKRPQFVEALLIWYIDTIDAKLAALGEELHKTSAGKFTPPLLVVDKMSYYRPKLTGKIQ